MKRIFLLVVLSAFYSATFAQAKKAKTPEDYIKAAPFKMPVISPPSFPSKTFSITAYGAKSDGQFLNTQAFANAIDATVKAGGGKVIVPAGVWLTGPIQLQSNVNLHVERGGIILFTKDLTQYPIIKASATSTSYTPAAPIYGYDLTNIAITGEGIIDGSGEAWRPVKKNKLTASEWKTLTSSGGVVSAKGDIWWPSKEAMEGEAYLKQLKKDKPKAAPEDYIPARTFMRPYMLFLVGCKNILIDQITLLNSPKFVFYPSLVKTLLSVMLRYTTTGMHKMVMA